MRTRSSDSLLQCGRCWECGQPPFCDQLDQAEVGLGSASRAAESFGAVVRVADRPGTGEHIASIRRGGRTVADRSGATLRNCGERQRRHQSCHKGRAGRRAVTNQLFACGANTNSNQRSARALAMGEAFSHRTPIRCLLSLTRPSAWAGNFLRATMYAVPWYSRTVSREPIGHGRAGAGRRPSESTAVRAVLKRPSP
jgi:hypothetical protein